MSGPGYTSAPRIRQDDREARIGALRFQLSERFGRSWSVRPELVPYALEQLAAGGADVGDLTPEGVVAFRAPTRKAARVWQLFTLVAYGHRSIGPVEVMGGWLYAYDLRQALADTFRQD